MFIHLDMMILMKSSFLLFLHRVARPQDSLLGKRRVGPNKVFLFPIQTLFCVD